MGRVNFIDHGGVQILDIDFSHTSSTEEVVPIVEEAKRVICTAAPASLLIRTNISDMPLDGATVKVMREYLAHNKPYVRASAVIGVGGLYGMYKTFVNTLSMLAQRDLKAFLDPTEALDWLAEFAGK